MTRETHSASRIILATPRAIFRAFLDPESVVNWRPPAGMTAELHAFDPRPGGGYRMTLVYVDVTRQGKSAADRDVVRGRFVELVPDEKMVEAVEFESGDAAFAGTMTITTTLRVVTGGTKVTITAENVPPGISQEDHHQGMESTLKNLATLLE